MTISIALWPFLLGLALALNFSELIARKWRGIAQRGKPQTECV